MTVTFVSGMTEATVSVPIIDDNTQELTENFYGVLSSDDPNVSIGEDIANITILDDDGKLVFMKQCGKIGWFCSSKPRI